MTQKAQNIRSVKAHMVLQGVTNRSIAKKGGVSATWVSLVIHNRGKSERIRKLIAEALSMAVEDLWPDDNKNKHSTRSS